MHPTHPTGKEKAPRVSSLLQLYLKHVRFQSPVAFANPTYPELFTELHRLKILCQQHRATCYKNSGGIPINSSLRVPQKKNTLREVTGTCF